MGSTQSKETPAPPRTKQPDTLQQAKRAEDWSAALRSKALSKDLQSLVDDDDDENIWDQVYEGHAPESTDTSLRYAAYASRFRTILLSAHRYVAYTSEIGESFRPVAHPWLIKGAYAVSWAYLIGDVSHEGYKAYLRQQNILHPDLPSRGIAKRATSAVESLKQGDVSALVQRAKDEASTITQASQDVVALSPGSGRVPAIDDYRAVMAQRAVFQTLASMLLPAATIHSIVKYSGRALRNAKAPVIRTWGPVGLGLSAVPFLPYIFDKPVEGAVEFAFHSAFRTLGGEEAVGHSPKTGREQHLEEENKTRKLQHKEL